MPKQGGSCCSTANLLHKPVWRLATVFGMRRLGRWIKKAYPKEYGETITHFKTTEPVVALTIDDGLSRGGAETSMAQDVLDLLAKYNNAHATFFVCTDYITNQQDDIVRNLFEGGHELGNHMLSDKLWYYNKLDKEEFQQQLEHANSVLDDLEEQHGKKKGKETRWFRAPQGIMTANMRDAVKEQENMHHVLGDCYCDDWSFAQEADRFYVDDNNDGDNNNTKLQRQREKAMKQVSQLMLRQVKPGSVAILHMPEKGFRQGNLLALEFFLQGLQRRGLRCVNLTEMKELCQPDVETEDTEEEA